MHTSRKILFLYLPILILFWRRLSGVLKAPDHFSWSADLLSEKRRHTSVLSQLFYSDTVFPPGQLNGWTRDGNIVTFSGLPDLRSLTLFRFDPTNTQESYRVITRRLLFLEREAFYHGCRRSEAQASPLTPPGS